VVCGGVAIPAAHGQALVTASRIGELQAGGGFSLGRPDYDFGNIKGGTFYASYDIRPHWGVEVDFHQLNASDSVLYERTYEVGGRYLTRSFGRMHPYAKGMYGRGVLNIPAPNQPHVVAANLAYNLFSGGAGVDFNVRPWLNARVDVEYQHWLSGTLLPNGLTPLVGTVGVAYRFGSYKLNGRQWVFPKSRPEKPAKASKDMPPPTRTPLPAPAQEPPPAAPPAQ
jgi:hypothetical protein